MTLAGPKPKDSVLAVDPYVGGDAGQPGAIRLARLASNEGPLGTSPKAAEAYRALATQLHRYPDGGANAVRESIAGAYGYDDPGRIVCGAGSDEVIGLLCQAYLGVGVPVVVTQHAFLMYRIYAALQGAEIRTAPEQDCRIDVDAILARVDESVRLVFLANPNNPTGAYVSAQDLRRLHAGLPEDTLLVVDQAYGEYVDAPDFGDGRALAAAANNVAVLGTGSKLYGLAGLRIGWGYCPPAVADALNRVRSPFNVTAPAQAACVAALSDTAFVEEAVAHNASWRRWLLQRLERLGIPAYPSQGNFVLARVGERSQPDQGAQEAERLRLALKERGVLVRQMGAYGLAECLRISIGNQADMEQLDEALTALVGVAA